MGERLKLMQAELVNSGAVKSSPGTRLGQYEEISIINIKNSGKHGFLNKIIIFTSENINNYKNEKSHSINFNSCINS